MASLFSERAGLIVQHALGKRTYAITLMWLSEAYNKLPSCLPYSEAPMGCEQCQVGVDLAKLHREVARLGLGDTTYTPKLSLDWPVRP